MINKRQKQRIVKAFGAKYSTPIIAVLNKARIKNQVGKPFSQESIRQFVGGKRENERVENKILAEAEKKLAKN